MPNVSIIIRTKNEERWISSCLDAVFKQEYKDFEVILVDNQSTDQTIEKAKKYPIHLVSIKNFLPGKAINIVSDSNQDFPRSLIYVQNKNANAKKTTILELQQDTVAMEVPTFKITSAQESNDIVNITANGLTSGTGLLVKSQTTSLNGGTLLKINHDMSTDGAIKGTIVNFVTTTTGSSTANVGDCILARFKAQKLENGILCELTPNSLTSGYGIYLESSSTGLTNNGRLTYINHLGATTSSGILNEFKTAAQDNTILAKFTATDDLAIGKVIQISAAEMTTGTAIDISDLSKLTTGCILNISSNSPSTATRNLVNITNDNTAAINTRLLYLKNNAIPSEAAVTFESTTVNTDHPILELKNSNTSTLNYAVLDFNRSDTTTVANNMGLGRLNFKNDSTSYCMIRTLAHDVTGATSSGAMIFDIRTSNSTSRFLSLAGGLTGTLDCEVIINDDAIDCNFRVESVNNPNMLFVDAANNKVGIGVPDPDSLLEVYGITTQQKWSYDVNSFATLAVLDGSHTTIATGQSGNLTLDVAGNIILDTAGNDISFKNNGTQELKFSNSSGSWTIQPQTSDKDLILRSNGEGNVITHLTDNGADSEFIIKNDTGIPRFSINALGTAKLTSGVATSKGLEIIGSQTSSSVLDITANSLIGGKGISIASTTTGMTGNLLDISLTGSNTGNTGNLVYLNNGAPNSANVNDVISLNINQTQSNNNTLNPVIKLSNGTFGTADDNCSETYLLKDVSAANNRADFDISLDDNSTYFLRAFIVGRYNDEAATPTIHSGVYTVDSFLDKTGGLTIDYTIEVKKESDASWDIQLLDQGNNLRVRCIGTSTTKWLLKIELTKITW